MSRKDSENQEKAKMMVPSAGAGAMTKTTLKISGMMCSMCEAHINDHVRAAFKIKKVTSSHGKGETVILSETPLDKEKLKSVVSDTGYSVTEIKEEPYEKKGFWARLFG